VPGDDGSGEIVSCSTQDPAGEASGLRFMDTPSRLVSEVPYVTELVRVPAASRTETVAPELSRPSAPVDDGIAPGAPAGIPDAPANTSIACRGASVVPAANAWRMVLFTWIVHPDMSTGAPPTFTSSTNSPAVLEPGS